MIPIRRANSFHQPIDFVRRLVPTLGIKHWGRTTSLCPAKVGTGFASGQATNPESRAQMTFRRNVTLLQHHLWVRDQPYWAQSHHRESGGPCSFRNGLPTNARKRERALAAAA